MPYFTVRFTVDLPYPKEVMIEKVRAGNYGSAIARAWRELRKQVPRKRINGTVRVQAVRY